MKFLLTLIISLNLTLSVYAQSNQQIDDKSKKTSIEASQKLKNDIKLNSSTENQINSDLNINNVVTIEICNENLKNRGSMTISM